MQPFWGFRRTRTISYYRPNGCLALILVFLGTPLLWLGVIALWLHAGSSSILKEIAAAGIVALVILGLASVHLVVLLRQLARQRTARRGYGPSDGISLVRIAWRLLHTI